MANSFSSNSLWLPHLSLEVGSGHYECNSEAMLYYKYLPVILYTLSQDQVSALAARRRVEQILT